MPRSDLPLKIVVKRANVARSVQRIEQGCKSTIAQLLDAVRYPSSARMCVEEPKEELD